MGVFGAFLAGLGFVAIFPLIKKYRKIKKFNEDYQGQMTDGKGLIFMCVMSIIGGVGLMILDSVIF